MKWFTLFLLILLSGCTDAPAPEPQVVEAPDPDIFGFALDENGDLLNNATLTLYPDEKTVLTVNGTFEFFNVTRNAPIHIEARKDGHRNSSANLQLSDGISAQVIFPMPRLESLPPQYFVAEFHGYLACKTAPVLPCPIASDDQYATYTAIAPDSDLSLQQTIAELFWTPARGTETLHLTIHEDEDLAFDNDITPGWKWVNDGPENQFTFTVSVSEPGFALNQQFDLFITNFYNRPGDAEYSIASS